MGQAHIFLQLVAFLFIRAFTKLREEPINRSNTIARQSISLLKYQANLVFTQLNVQKAKSLLLYCFLHNNRLFINCVSQCILDYFIISHIIMLELTWLQKTAIKVLKQGKVPAHISFIMDGNRRYAKNQNHKALSGHEEGTKTLKKCLLYCLELGVKYASFYAFSIQNFNRTEQEVKFLMTLARKEVQNLSQIYQQQNIVDIITKNNVKVIIAGDLDGKLKQLFPDLRENFSKIEEKTKHNTAMTLYLCFAYDSVFQYNTALEKAIEQKKQSANNQKLDLDKTKIKIEQKDIYNNLLVAHPVDLLIRTSNEYRLSNFMLMQVRYGLIEIEKNFWPAFNLLMLARILLKYNYFYNEIKYRRLSLPAEQKQE